MQLKLYYISGVELVVSGPTPYLGFKFMNSLTSSWRKKLSYKSKRIIFLWPMHSYYPICRQVFHRAQTNIFALFGKFFLLLYWVELSGEPNRVSLSIWIIIFHDVTFDYPTQQSCYKPSQHSPNYFIWFNSQKT